MKAGCITILPQYLKKYTPMFELGFLPLINDHSFRHTASPPPPPPITIGYAMPAFPQEKISHYTTGWVAVAYLGFHFGVGSKYFCKSGVRFARGFGGMFPRENF